MRSRFNQLSIAALVISLWAGANALAQNNTGNAPPASQANDPPVSLDLVRSDIGDALRLLAQEGGINIVVGPEVKAEVSVSLKNVPVRQALRSLVEANGFKWSEHDGVITVTKPSTAATTETMPALFTKILRPKCVNAATLVSALQPALSKWGRLTILSEDSRPGFGIGSIQDGSNQPQGTTFRSASRSDMVVNAISTPSGSPTTAGYAGERAAAAGSQTGIENSQVLLVTDTRERIEEISKLVSELDVPPRQVLIECRIVEMSTDLQKRLGIDWNIETFANGPVLYHELPLDWAAGFAPGPINGLALGTVDFTRFTGLLQVAQDDNAVRLLANPRMLVFNNHTASILVGEKYPLLTSTITDQGTTTESFDSYIPIGVQLSVTPTIMSDGRVTLLVHPATSALGPDVVGTTGLRIARIFTRELDTRVVMRDADTVVLGGLISDRKTYNVHKVPGLGDVPILDIFTRQERPKEERVDLLVFLTAHVEKAAEMSQEEKDVYTRYTPRFKHSDAMDEVPLHFELPGTQFYDKKQTPPPDGAPSDDSPSQKPTDLAPVASPRPPVDARPPADLDFVPDNRQENHR